MSESARQRGRARPGPSHRSAPRRPSRPAGGPAWRSLCEALRRSRSSRRLTWLLAAYLAVTALIGGRLLVVQVVAAEDYRELGERQTHREITMPADRGRLYDRSGTPMALTETAAAVYADPSAIRRADAEPGEIAATLAGHLDADTGALRERLTRDTSFVYVERQLPHALGEAIRAERLPGVGVLEEPTRRYPSGSLAAAVLGYVGIDHEGLAGLELQHDDALAGTAGALQVERAPGGVPISAAPREGQPPVPGDDLVLTLDRRVQLAAEETLERALDTHDAAAGSAVVLDARTAEVLGMATVPGFDPEQIGAVEPARRRNRPVTDAFEPGSAAKAITVAAALEADVVSADEELVLPAEIEVGGKTFRDPGREEDTIATFAEAIAKSSNVATIRVAQRLGAERLHAAYERFGFGRPTGIGFPGETAGSLPPVDEWWATSLPTIALGQGTSASLLQLAGMMQTLANDGQRRAPTLLRGEVGSDGQLQPVAASEADRVVSPEAAAVATDVLTGVVADGTGRRAAVDGYRVAGKTGTAQKPHPDRRGYQEDSYLATFAGFAPADDPEIVVAVVLDDPEPMWASQTAAPVFADILEETLRVRRVPPRDETAPADAGADPDGDRDPGSLADGEPVPP